ncbi:MAG: hypothetical protein IKE28_12305 [Solobacterium sp.]|nr:hypothetical protein [Solobacterium sp.]
MKYIINKFKDKAGSSLVETLATVVLLGIMGIALVTGIATIQNTYKKIVRKANEQTILSTTLIEMRNEIRKSVDYDAGRFQSRDGYWFSFREAGTGEKGIYIDYYMTKDATTPIQKRPVVSEANGDVSKVYSSFGDGGGVKKESDGLFVIEKLQVGEAGSTNVTKIDSYYVSQITRRK